MPVHKTKGGWKWGTTGKVYKTKAGAEVNKTLTIGGQDFRICSWDYDKNVLFMPCPKGTAFKLTNNNTGQGSYEFKKYPCKGV